MSLTNIVYTPVDTGTAKISLNMENAKGRFYGRGCASKCRDRACPVFTIKSQFSIIWWFPDQLARLRYMVIVVSSKVPLMTNSVALILISSNFCASSSDSVVTVFVL